MVIALSTIESFSKHNATSKRTWKWRGNIHVWEYDIIFTVAFDVASCLLKLSNGFNYTGQKYKVELLKNKAVLYSAGLKRGLYASVVL